MKSTILIVDDEPSARSTLEALLAGENCNLQMAASGQEALDMANASPPDLVLLDVMMPGMDGFEVCRRIRSTPNLAEVPIVILTALEDHFFLVRGIEAGADDFLTKPVERQELIARVHTIIRLNRYRTLLQQRENLRQMASKLVSAQEEERRRISRELHDELGQALTAFNLGLNALKQDPPDNNSELNRRVDLLISETNSIHARVRALAQDLRPPMLDALGLQQSLITYCQEFSSRTGIPVQVEIIPTLPSFSDSYAVILYRALQETLTNVIKHAHASRVWVELEQEENGICLTVQDDGQGFHPDAPKTKGIGLIGLRERLSLVGGSLNIRSSPGRGSVLSVWLPVETSDGQKGDS